MSIAVVARQPIYRPNMDVYGYELLFRKPNEQVANIVDGNQATATVITNSFVDIGWDTVTAGKLGFINMTRDFILADHAETLPKEQVVLEVLEDIEPDDEILQKLQHLNEQGYKIALDDFVYHENLLPLVEKAHIIKVEYPAVSPEDLLSHVKKLRRYGVKLLAEKIETHDDFEICRSLGFDYYQGYFFCRPQIIESQRISTNRVAVLSLLSKLQNPSIHLEKIEEVIMTEPTLSYKLLRFVNSVAFSLPRKIESIRHAASLAGIQRIKSFASLLLLATLAEDKPVELVSTALVRAKMCELLADSDGRDRLDQYFTVGLFSLLDALTDRPLTELLDQIPLSDEISVALLHQNGDLGRTLQEVVDYQLGMWDPTISQHQDKLPEIYWQAITWADETVKSMS